MASKQKGGLKRHKIPEKKVDASNRSKKKNRTTQAKVARSPSPSISGNSSEEALPSRNVAPEPAMVYKEPSMYDSLLMTLGSGNDTFANVYRRRQREEEGRSDTEDEDDGSESPSVSGDEDDDSEEGPDNESGWDPSTGTDLQEPTQATMLQSDDAESEHEDEPFDTDQEDGVDDNGQSRRSVDISLLSISSFNIHLGHVFKQAEADELAKQKQKFKWEVPAVDIPMSKWVGTGDCFFKENNESSDYGLKLKLYKHWLDLYNSSGGNDFHSSRQRQFFSLCNSYRDILHCNKRPFYLKGLGEDSSIMDGYIMHALNHVFKTRDLVTKNEAKLVKLRENNKEESLNGEEFLDHGYTRPKNHDTELGDEEYDMDGKRGSRIVQFHIVFNLLVLV
ncbi:U3 small nucleolar rna-associated protein [Thalictrum thalictroides]|uniref:U3 small nucleolar rna-associated protein n=1 Tax=Thalictrum thalictroides TaxID=46969 RepID=A0A7J6UXN9_THATH|nr:U3 small nucleolar rna-associated protein [Thalictrum thalictroides]